MQPDLPEPVVPAIRMCGMRARSVQTACAGDVLAEPDRERARRRRQVVVDVAERDEVRARGSAPRRRPPACPGSARGCGSRSSRARSERSSFRPATFDDLRARRELQLVARDARAGDLADHGRVDAEVRERLDERLGDARAVVGVRAVAAGGDRRRSVAVRQAVLGVLGGSTVTSKRLCLARARRLRCGRRAAAAARRETRSGKSSTTSTGGAQRARRRRGARPSSTLQARLGAPARGGIGCARRGARRGRSGGESRRATRRSGAARPTSSSEDAEDRDAGRADRERRGRRRAPCPR